MSAEAALLVRSWKVGSRTVTMTVPKPRGKRPAFPVMDWSPQVPRNLTADEWAQYRAGRDAALAELAQSLGGTVAVVEL